jgi:hypothetical protein
MQRLLECSPFVRQQAYHLNIWLRNTRPAASESAIDWSILGEALSNITDYKRTGEISCKGSISGSDFDSTKRLTEEFKLQTTHTTINIIRRRRA